MWLQPAYAAWDATRERQGWIQPPAHSLAPVNSSSRRLNTTLSSRTEGRGGLGTRPSPASPPNSRPTKPPKRAGLSSATLGENLANFLPTAGVNSEPAHDDLFWRFNSSLNPDDPSVARFNAGALEFFSRLKRDSRQFELRAFASQTVTDLNDIQRSLLTREDVMMAGRFGNEPKAHDTLIQLARTLLLLLLIHSKPDMEIWTSCNRSHERNSWQSLQPCTQRLLNLHLGMTLYTNYTGKTPVGSVMPLKRCVLRSLLSPRLVYCRCVMLLAQGPPSVMIFLSLHRLQKA